MRDAVLTIFIFASTFWIYRVLGIVVVRAIRTGRSSIKGAIFERADRPAMYYFAILIFSLFLAVAPPRLTW